MGLKDREVKQIRASTAATHFAKFLFALTFVVPGLVLPLSTAIVAGFFRGTPILSIMSYAMARSQGKPPGRAWANTS
jgi:hypothetical protein